MQATGALVGAVARRSDVWIATGALALYAALAWRRLGAVRHDLWVARTLIADADDQIHDSQRTLTAVAQRASRAADAQEATAVELAKLRCAVERISHACSRGTREDFVVLPCDGNALVDQMLAQLSADGRPGCAYVNATHSVLSVLQLLWQHGTSCAVVVDDAAHFVGIADMTTVAWGVLQSVAASAIDAQSLAPIVLNDTVMRACEGSAGLLTRLRGHHRYVGVIVRGPDAEEHCAVVSQYDVLRLLFKESRQRGLLARSIQSLGLGAQKCVIVVHPTDTVQSAFRRMLSSGITSLPLVDGARRAQGVVSASDIVYLPASMDEWAETLNMPCREFLDTRVRRSNGIASTDVVTCGVRDDLYTVVAAMLRHDVRHVYVAEHGAVCGVVSCVDVLRVLL